MLTYATNRRAMDLKYRRVRRGAWKDWATHDETTITCGKIKVDPEDASLWEWVAGTKQLIWARPARRL